MPCAACSRTVLRLRVKFARPKTLCNAPGRTSLCSSKNRRTGTPSRKRRESRHRQRKRKLLMTPRKTRCASRACQLYSSTPALTAMTAAGLDYVSGGRFTLGLGASGPQVIEGWHGGPYDAPIGRNREVLE